MRSHHNIRNGCTNIQKEALDDVTSKVKCIYKTFPVSGSKQSRIRLYILWGKKEIYADCKLISGIGKEQKEMRICELTVNHLSIICMYVRTVRLYRRIFNVRRDRKSNP